MKRVISVFFVALLIVAIIGAQDLAFAQQPKVPVLVLFVSNANENQEVQAVGSVDGEITHEFTIVDAVAALVPEARIQELKKNPLVLSVDPDVEVRATDLAADKQILADQVWSSVPPFTGSGVRLAILDTGIATAHPEFGGRIVACHTEVPGTTTCEDDNGHGTHVAGIAGAAGVNPDAKGVAPSVLFMGDKVLDSGGSGSVSGVVAGIDWAVTNSAAIISMSLGTSPVDGGGTLANCDSFDATLTAAVNSALARGVTVVAAAGNAGTAGLGAPGCISSVIAVGAVDSTDTLASFSSAGAALLDHGIVAPGVNIFSTWLNGGYGTLSGTSMATPMVSGTIALMLSKSTQTPTTVRNTLFATADCPSTLAPCPSTNVGHGRVNAFRAVNPSTPPPFDFSVSVNPTSGSVVQGGTQTATVTVTLLSGSIQPVTLSTALPVPPPTGISVGLSTVTGNPTFTSTLTMSTTISIPTGTYTITITGTGGGLTRSTTYSLSVTSPSPPDFDFFSASPSSLTIDPGSSGSTTITVTSLNGFGGSVTLSIPSASPLPSGVTASFTPNPLPVPSGGSPTSTLTLTVASSATPVTGYAITISGSSSSPSISHTVTITITISTNQQGQN